MESLTGGLPEGAGREPERREQIGNLLESTEEKFSDLFASLADDFSRVDGFHVRVSTLASFHLRKLLSVHAQGISRPACANAAQSHKSRVFTLSAEPLLMQHNCHWFCKSKAVASTPLLVWHQTLVRDCWPRWRPRPRQLTRPWQAAEPGAGDPPAER